ncbi:DNA-binding NarL/FixJ family response regulator [Oxalobacteraceae bacterium GrIS 2.11]
MQTPEDDTLIRVMLVEDDIDFQKFLISAIEAVPDMQLMAVASTRAQGLQMLETTRFDVLLVDLGLPDGSGIDIITAAHTKYPQSNIMVSTTFGDELHVMQSLEAGASGYLLKDSESRRIVFEIRSLHRGGSPISPLIARQILTRFHRDKTPLKPSSAPQQNAVLSAREKEVLEYITRGFTAEEIATLIAVSRHTVLTYVRRIYTKLEVNSKAEAIYEARTQGLLDD